MENFFDEITKAVRQTRELNSAVNNQVNNMAELMDGRLQHVRVYWLRRMKKELQNFNAVTGEWKK